jgi:phosphatidylethanolamine/phosphatidyl-N-methylethanolamine N-methyltransferase
LPRPLSGEGGGLVALPNGVNMGTLSVQKVYDSYAFFYNFIFGKIFNPGRKLSVDIINHNAVYNAKVIEVGVGTGLSLPLYRPDLQISGVDISERMLNKAKARIVSHQLQGKSLHVMDATNLDFPDESFDFVVAMYVVSVVSDIQKFLEEISRVCKKNGDIVIVNHFVSSNKILNRLEKFFSGAHSFIGFRSDFSMDQILEFSHFKLINIMKTNLFGYWKMLHLKKT